MAKIDKKTSKICHSLNSKVFKVKDMIFELMHHLCTLGVEVLQCTTCGQWRDRFFTERKGKYRVEDKELVKEKLQEKSKKKCSK